MNKLKCYYSHPMLTYGSTIEQKDLSLLNFLGFEVINPNQPDFQSGCEEYARLNGKDKVMDFFKLEVLKCDVIAFRGQPCGEILSGVGYEVKGAMEFEMPIIELPVNLVDRIQEYPETKRYLTEIGFYKVKC